MPVPIDVLRDRLRLIEGRFDAYTKQAELNGGRLKRHEVWRRDYLSFPYLLGASDDRIAQRFRDVFINTTELNNDAKLVPLPVNTTDSFMQKFAHLLEEYGVRNGLPIDVVGEARKPAVAYFENGEPIAVRMFSGYTPPGSPFAVKYGRRELLEPMLHTGRLRICPASYYNNSAQRPFGKSALAFQVWRCCDSSIGCGRSRAVGEWPGSPRRRSAIRRT